ncbi:MAG: hypothetical protein ACPGQL_03820 [Thermoplasmatota archaeon]
MRSELVLRLIGGLVLVMVAPILLWVEEPLGTILAFNAAVIGVLLVFVLPERSLPAEGAEAALHGATEQAMDVASGLGLGGHPVYVNLDASANGDRLFLPTRPSDLPLPALDATTMTYAGDGGTQVGLAVRPSGARLLALAGDETSLQPGAPLGQVTTFLRGAGRRNGWFKELEIDQELDGAAAATEPGQAQSRQEDGLRVAFVPDALRLPCQDAQEPACPRTGCSVCQVIGCAVARNRGRPMELHDAEITPDRVRLRLRPVS